MSHYIDSYDVAVIGAGHAGVEAALAAARLGAKTVMFTISLDNIANSQAVPMQGKFSVPHNVSKSTAKPCCLFLCPSYFPKAQDKTNRTHCPH